MMEAVWSARRAARQLCLSDCVVRRRLGQWIRKIDSGRPRQASCREDHQIIKNARVQPTASWAAIQTQIAPSLGIPVSSRTIRKRLVEGHFRSRPHYMCCPRRPHMDESVLSGVAREETCLQWNGTTSPLDSRFNLSSEDNRVCVCRPRGERLHSAFALQQQTTPTVNVMAWGIIAYNTRRYVHDILQPHMLPLKQRLPRAIFQQDNACHKTVSTQLLTILCLPDR
ncbi:transposable element Tcb2 transposase [Trichonephila clavipes]|nr:transposable element Tcb2 transposase [Trichonephila clavipes]